MQADELRRVDVAWVWVDEQPAARLVRSPDGVRLHYLDDYRGRPIATTLPRDVGEVLFAGGAIGPFFAGLLPEGRRLAAVRSATKTSADDDLTLLLAVGEDTIGNVRILPERAPTDPQTASEDTIAPNLDEVDFAELFAAVLRQPMRDRRGIPGAQDKVSGQMISLPLRHAGAHWILKLDPPAVAHLVDNEAFFLAAAKESGLQTAHAEILRDRTGRPGLLVQRFDRELSGGAIRRLAQEDACQVLGRYPADKYRLTTEEVITGLARVCGAPIVAARTLLQQFAFAYLTCNGDAHAKNFSIVRRQNEWHVAPAYDLPSTHPYDDTTMALSLQGRDREDIRRADFIALGEQCGVPQKATARVLDGLLGAVATWIDRLGELPFDQRRVLELQQACRYRAERLAGK